MLITSWMHREGSRGKGASHVYSSFNLFYLYFKRDNLKVECELNLLDCHMSKNVTSVIM